MFRKAVDILPDRKLCPQFHRGVTILIIETPCTLWTDVLIRKLKGEVTPFWRQKLLPQSDSRGNRLSDAPPEEEELSKGEIMESWRITCISRATCSFQK